MKNIEIRIVAILLMIFSVSCEQTVSNIELPYKEQIVVFANLRAGEPIKGISIRKTLPPLEQLDLEKMLIRDAEVTIYRGDEVFTCEFDPEIDKYTCPTLVPQIGDKLKLEVRWKGKRVYSQTSVPPKPDILDYDYKISKNGYEPWSGKEVNVFVNVKLADDWAYRAYDSPANIGYSYYIYSDVYVLNSVAKDSIAHINFLSTYYYDYEQDFLIDTYAVVMILDYAYYDYYRSSENDFNDDFIFGTSGVNADWNVKGDGFGVFIASNEDSLKVKFQIKKE